ncbi:MAG: bifunctional 5,10-methylene-tetrahydrofolate dehydrogenase/5,10-methylene-tetrahydrofolate cyclohydrolase [Muribaculaceae bacterium]|nr:bifunctional 5,10-methylene-tetrahydrofolate dehydrogenase/5,10-methylene-tetrahydrofolate cyclohydrolase [Muribaculaceae bacterium]MBQ7211736.1 bifunctional 5,10-methylene-tetrahydrofolate dehydrogenase/5,10-methylene-tetrahydrofolate cyclohydrolase [Muribaculaceae bacterium]
MTIIDGKQTADTIMREISQEVMRMTSQGERPPHLVAVLVGDNPASVTYVGNKVKACLRCGFKSTVERLPADTSESDLLAKISQLNADTSVDGFIVQLPLPEHIDEQKVIEAINPQKDVDGFTPVNVGRMALGLPGLYAATPSGILELFRRYNIHTEGANCVVIGRSNIVGRPMAELMMQKAFPGNATVTVCHSLTHDVARYCRNADIIIAAIGQPGFVKADMVKDGAVVIDVGITRVDDSSSARGYRLAGDVDFVNVAPKCSYISPVPGGVGPMTIVSLMRNTIKAARLYRR